MFDLLLKIKTALEWSLMFAITDYVGLNNVRNQNVSGTRACRINLIKNKLSRNVIDVVHSVVAPSLWRHSIQRAHLCGNCVTRAA